MIFYHLISKWQSASLSGWQERIVTHAHCQHHCSVARNPFAVAAIAAADHGGCILSALGIGIFRRQACDPQLVSCFARIASVLRNRTTIVCTQPTIMITHVQSSTVSGPHCSDPSLNQMIARVVQPPVSRFIRLQRRPPPQCRRSRLQLLSSVSLSQRRSSRRPSARRALRSSRWRNPRHRPRSRRLAPRAPGSVPVAGCRFRDSSFDYR